MSIETFNETPLSEKDQLLDQLNALDKNKSDYQEEKRAIKERLRQIAENPNETINALSLQAEKTLARFDNHKHNIAREEKNDQTGINKIWQEINAQASTKLTADRSSLAESPDASQYEGFYLNKLYKVAVSVKKAIHSFNWRSLRQLSQEDRDKLCAQIDSIVAEAKIAITNEEAKKSDELIIRRLNNEAIYQIQKIADDRHIKIPGEY